MSPVPCQDWTSTISYLKFVFRMLEVENLQLCKIRRQQQAEISELLKRAEKAEREQKAAVQRLKALEVEINTKNEAVQASKSRNRNLRNRGNTQQPPGWRIGYRVGVGL